MPVVPAGHSPASSVLAMAWVSATWSSSLIAHMTASIIPPFSRQQICLQARYASLETLLSLEARREIGREGRGGREEKRGEEERRREGRKRGEIKDRKSTRLNSSH